MHVRRFSFLLLPVCATWLGCAGGEPGPEPELNDSQASANAGDAGTPDDVMDEGCGDDGGTPEGTVQVTSFTRFHTAVGVALRPNDLTANPPEVLVPNGNTFTRITGTPVPGGITFTGVPNGPYYLKTGSTTYVVTDERHVDISVNRLGREDTVFAEQSFTPVQVNLTNTAPWVEWRSGTQPGSTIQVASAQVDLFANVDILDGVPEGSTSILSTQSELWSGTGLMPNFEAARGDRLYVNQLSPMDAGTLPNGVPIEYSAVVRSVQMGAFDFAADGVTPMPINGVMQPTPMSSFPLEWRLGEYTRRAQEVHPAATPSLPYFYLTPAAHGLGHGWIGYSGELLTLSLPRGASYDFTRRLTYGNPFPSTWSVVAAAQYSFRSLQPVPNGNGRQLFLSGSFLTYDRLENLIAGPVQPRISSPRELTIDGVPASVSREVGSASPVIAWLPPTLGTPSAYRVSVSRLQEIFEGQYVLSTYSRVYLPGSATQVRLPPGMTVPGGVHYIRVSALDAPAYDVEREPFTFAEKLPLSQAEAISSFIVTP